MNGQYRTWHPNRDETVWYLIGHQGQMVGLIRAIDDGANWEVVSAEGEVLEQRYFFQIAKDRAEVLF